VTIKRAEAPCCLFESKAGVQILFNEHNRTGHQEPVCVTRMKLDWPITVHHSA